MEKFIVDHRQINLSSPKKKPLYVNCRYYTKVAQQLPSHYSGLQSSSSMNTDLHSVTASRSRKVPSYLSQR